MSDKTQRPPGYYWVMEYDTQMVAEWDGQSWWVPGGERPWKDSNFARILSKTPLEREQP